MSGGPRIADDANPTPPETRPRGGILVGGRSARMGAPKQLLNAGGRNWLERSVAALRPHVREIVLLGDGAAPPSCVELRRIADEPGVEGPLAALIAALKDAPPSAWIICACDLPCMTPAAVEWLSAARTPERIAILPRGADGTIEPLLALYEPAALPALIALAEGRGAPHRLANRSDVHSPPIPAELAACWTNVNTPEDLRRWRSGMTARRRRSGAKP